VTVVTTHLRLQLQRPLLPRLLDTLIAAARQKANQQSFQATMQGMTFTIMDLVAGQSTIRTVLVAVEVMAISNPFIDSLPVEAMQPVLIYTAVIMVRLEATEMSTAVEADLGACTHRTKTIGMAAAMVATTPCRHILMADMDSHITADLLLDQTAGRVPKMDHLAVEAVVG